MSNIRRRRLAANLTQAQLAELSGIPQPNIAAYETGRRTPSLGSLNKLDRALQPRPSDVVQQHRDTILSILATFNMTNPALFGSVATAQDRPGSDVDLLVDAAPNLDLLDIADAADQLAALLGVAVDIVTPRSLRPGHRIAATAVPL